MLSNVRCVTIICPADGAMKSTRSGHQWAHVSCALWIPEVSIGDVEKMEPVTKISNVSVSSTATAGPAPGRGGGGGELGDCPVPSALPLPVVVSAGLGG